LPKVSTTMVDKRPKEMTIVAGLLRQESKDGEKSLASVMNFDGSY
jgi:hypothetical protein